VVAHVASVERSWRPFVRHDPTRRSYRRLVWTPEHEVWLLCWPPGQLVDVHDHGRSAGAFAVTDGSLREDHVDAGSWRKLICRPGVVRTFPAGHVHAVWNPGPVPAISLHAYTPPLESMTFYSRDVEAGLQPARVELVAGVAR
jgi:predicted metal-dependent enzyme (double-stranded beta helix superfamily)